MNSQKHTSDYLLLIEDSEMDIRLFLSVLEWQITPCKVEIFRYGNQGIEFLSRQYENLPKVIVIDVMLPDISGIELLEQIKSYPQLSKIPVVMWSGIDSSRYRETCKKLGASCYLSKPIGLTEFDQCVKQVLNCGEGMGQRELEKI